MTRLPAASSVIEQASLRPALLALPPSPSGSLIPVPTGVVSRPVAGSIWRTAANSPMYRLPPPDDAPHGVSSSEVAAAGPPTPPATVEMIPACPGRGAVILGWPG